MLKKVTVILILLLPAIYLYPQDFISGNVNEYLKVDSVYADTILYSGDASNFSPGDKVLLIQMTGVDLIYEGLGVGGRGIPNRGTRDDDNNTGKYEILQIAEVISAGSKMVFTAEMEASFDPSAITASNPNMFFQKRNILPSRYGFNMLKSAKKGWEVPLLVMTY